MSVKFRLLASAGIALALAVNACSSAAPAVPTAPPAPAATAAPAAPTAAPTVAPSPTAVTPPTVAPSPTTVTPPTAAPTNTVVAQAAASGPAVGTGILGQMGTAMTAATSYRVTITSVNSATSQPVTAVMEVVKPDRFHLKANTGGGKSIELIAIGPDSYINITGTWTKSPVAFPMATIIGNDPQVVSSQIVASQKNGTLTLGGLSQVNGAPCQEYTWTPAATAGTKGGTVCIDLKSGLLLQVKSTDGKTMLVFSDWNTPIAIVAPI
jgi:hypothetical protein